MQQETAAKLSGSGDDAEAQQPFLDSRDQIRSILARQRRCKLCKKITKICCISFGIVLVLVILALLFFFIWLWQQRCITFLDKNSPSPVQIGVDFANSRIFIILWKPIETGVFESALNVCGNKPKRIDTTVMGAFKNVSVGAGTLTLQSQACANLPDGIQPGNGDGELKIIIDGDRTSTKADLTGLNLAFLRWNDTNYANFSLLAEGGLDSNQSHSIRLVIPVENRISFRPAVGVSYSNFVAGFIEEILLLPSQSSHNHCGYDTIGVTLSLSYVGRALNALGHWMRGSFKPMSPIGLSQLVMPTLAHISDFLVELQPVAFSRQPQNNRQLQIDTQFSIHETRFNVERTFVTLKNVSFQMNDDGGDIKVKALARAFTNITRTLISGESKAKSISRFNASVGGTVLDLTLDVDYPIKSEQNGSWFDYHPHAGGLFELADVNIRTSAGSSVETGHVAANIKPVRIRMMQEATPISQQLYEFAFELLKLNATSPDGGGLAVTIVDPEQRNGAPFIFRLYEIGKLSNKVKLSITQPEAKNSSSSQIGVGSNSKTVQFWSEIDVSDIGVAIHPIDQYIKIERLAFKTGPSVQRPKIGASIRPSITLPYKT